MINKLKKKKSAENSIPVNSLLEQSDLEFVKIYNS